MSVSIELEKLGLSNLDLEDICLEGPNNEEMLECVVCSKSVEINWYDGDPVLCDEHYKCPYCGNDRLRCVEPTYCISPENCLWLCSSCKRYWDGAKELEREVLNEYKKE